jgi:3-oxoacyl-[acyl-carrier protein] reductase
LNQYLSGKKILITGGTSELGTAFVKQAIAHGAEIHFTFFSAAERAKELETIGAKKHKADLSSTEAIDSFLEAFCRENKTLDILIHNAAVAADHLLEKMTEEEWDRVLATNLKAPFYLTQKLLPLLEKRGSHFARTKKSHFSLSKIFMIVSRAGTEGLAGASNYAAAKGGLIAMTLALARELGPKKILVNAVNPGFMRSRLTVALSEKVIQRALGRSPLETLADPVEAANFLIYLSSDLVSRVTGQVFHFESRPLQQNG